MDAPQFALWLQGFAELNTEPPTKEQWQSIREHLQLVFTKVTPEVKKSAPVDLSGNEDLRKMLESARRAQGYQPMQPTPYFPQYFVDRPGAGGPIC